MTGEEQKLLNDNNNDPIARAARLSKPNCFPSNTAVLTMANMHHEKLLGLHLQSASPFPCLYDKLVVVCLDDAIFEKCNKIHSGLCLRASETYGASDFFKGNYTNIIYDIYKLWADTLERGIHLFMVDVDLVFLDQPRLLDFEFDLAFQREGFPHIWSKGFNTGQILVRASNPETIRLFRAVYQAPREKLDQTYLAELLHSKKFNVSYGFLSHQYVGYCSWLQGFQEPVLFLEAVTFHAHCCGDAEGKERLMSWAIKMARDVKNARRQSIIDQTIPDLVRCYENANQNKTAAEQCRNHRWSMKNVKSGKSWAVDFDKMQT